MELKDFVKTTLTELASAIKEANQEIGGNEIKITNTPLFTKGYGDNGLIDFDLAVTAAASKSSGGKGGIKIAVLEAGAGKNNSQTVTSVSRIKFTLQADF